MDRETANTVLGGVLAILVAVGVIILASIGKPIPTILSYVLIAAATWFFATSAPNIISAFRGGDKAVPPEEPPAAPPAAGGKVDDGHP